MATYAGENNDKRNADLGVLEIVPDGRRLEARPQATLLETLQQHGVAVGCSCGGHGRCGECRVRFVDEPPSPTDADRLLIDAELIAVGWRLACRHRVEGKLRIELPEAVGDLDQKASHDGGAPTGAPRPAVRAVDVQLDSPTRDDQRPWVKRLVDALGEPLVVPLEVVRELPAAIGQRNRATVIRSDREVIAVRGEPRGLALGMAIDVGTTTLATYLFDLASGRQLACAASINPQRRFGADVISRIAHVRRAETSGLATLQDAVIGGLNRLIARMSKEAGVGASSIVAASVVGNPTMLHLLMGVDPRGIDVSPFAAVFGGRLPCRAGELGLAIHPRAPVEALPAVSSYVGADIVAGVLATGLAGRDGSSLYLDIGTNGEIVLGFQGRLIACSTAAGPAFEGASIAQGTAAVAGAIEAVRLDDGRVEVVTIGDASPIGVCGTGLVSTVAELRAVGIVDTSGRLVDPGGPWSERLGGDGSRRWFRLTGGEHPVCLHQADVREFQLAKAAIRSGIERLLRHAGRRGEDLDRVLLAGAFSARLAARDLIATGLLPPIDPERIEIVGNAAGQGAKQTLLDRARREEVDRLSRRIEYVELSADPRFTELYIAQMRFPKLGYPPPAYGPSVPNDGRT